MDRTRAGARIRRTTLALALLGSIWAPAGAGAVQPHRVNGPIAFTAESTGNLDVYRINPDSTGRVNLTSNPATDGQPSWSPDATRIAFVSDRSGPYAGATRIFAMSASGLNPTDLSHPGAQTTDGEPAWAPTGSKIAFTRRGGGTARIFTMNTDGTGQTAVGTGTADTRPSWSPDGRRLAFGRFENRVGQNGTSQIYAMNADGTNAVNLSRAPQQFDLDPAWSPDGLKIVFTRFVAGRTDLFAMNADGSGQTNLTNTATGFESQAAWSPDGTKIVFTAFRGDSQRIMTMNRDGSGQTAITDSTTNSVEPDWGARVELRPTTKDDCKGNGWRNLVGPAGPFRNQGDCVSYVASGRPG